ncbi:MAG TPA: signal peptidase I [Firmicutes bacterium]|nr:signal peptidase I [Bacillota bacterium]
MINWQWLWSEWIRPILEAAALALFIVFFVAQSYKVDGSSMEKTLWGGERIVVDKLTYRFRQPRRGEIIVLKMPESRYIKRIIALGGDTILERSGTIYVNGIPLQESYVEHKTNMNWGPILVPKGHVWVMGDNRPQSDDSRGSVGFLPLRDIVGRAIFRFWPPGKVGLF